MNINNVQGEVVVKTDNVIHGAKDKTDFREEGYTWKLLQHM